MIVTDSGTTDKNHNLPDKIVNEGSIALRSHCQISPSDPGKAGSAGYCEICHFGVKVNDN